MGQDEPGETEAALQNFPREFAAFPPVLPRRLPGHQCPVQVGCPPGAQVTALAPAKVTTQQPQGHGTKAAAQAGSIYSILSSPWL